MIAPVSAYGATLAACATAQKLGVEATRCLVLEDSLNGVRAGVAAGMTVWAFVGGDHCDEALGEHLVAEGAERSVAPDGTEHG